MAHKANYRGGRNIALKVPPHQYDATVQFYRDLIGLPQINRFEPDVVFEFGRSQLWIDRVAALSQAELWLELVTDNLAAAEKELSAAGIVRCDEIEALPDGFEGFWISNPASIIHLVEKYDEAS